LKTLFAVNCPWEGWMHIVSVCGSMETTWNGAALFLEKSLCGARASAACKTRENAWIKKQRCFVNLSPVDGMFSLAGGCLLPSSKLQDRDCTALVWSCAICDSHSTHSWLWMGNWTQLFLIIEAMHRLTEVCQSNCSLCLKNNFLCWCLSELDCPTGKHLTSVSFQKELKKGFLCIAFATVVSSNCPTELTSCWTAKSDWFVANCWNCF